MQQNQMPSFLYMDHFPASYIIPSKNEIPKSTADLVVRSQLQDILHIGLEKKLTLVSAPPGFGKTTLVCDWIHRYQIAAGWVSLDRGDNDLCRFWQYLKEGLKTIHPEFDLSNSALKREASLSVETLVGLLIHQLSEIKHHFAFVLDNYQTIESNTIHHLVSYLLEHLPAHMHLYIISRSIPPFPLARLRVHRELQELGLEDLRFRREEAQIFFNRQAHTRLNPDLLELIYQDTRGWITGIRLTLMEINNRRDTRFVARDILPSREYITEYLLDEVFECQPRHVQQFLLYTSVLNRMNGALCEALTGQQHGQRMLDMLAKRNLFLITVDDERIWYSYDPLFARFLRSRLTHQDADLLATLHCKAYRWYERHQMYQEAVEHALAAGLFKPAAELLCSNLHALLHEVGLRKASDWLRQLPIDCLLSHIPLALLQVWVHITAYQPEEARGTYQRVEKEMRRHGNEYMKHIDHDMRMIEVYLHLLEGNVHQAIDQFRAAATSITHNSLFSQVLKRWRDENVLLLNSPLGLKGRLNKVSMFYQQLLSDPSIRGSMIEETFRLASAEIWYERGDHIGAFRHLKRKDHRHEFNVQRGILYAKIKQAEGQDTVALDFVQELKSKLSHEQASRWMHVLTALEIRIRLKMNDEDEAIDRWLDRCGLYEHDTQLLLREYEYMTFVRVLLVRGYVERADRLLHRILILAGREERLMSMIEAMLLQAFVYERRKEMFQAVTVFEEVLRLAEVHGYERLLMDEGPPTIRLLRYLNKKRGKVHSYTRKLLERYGREVNRNESMPSEMIKPMTKRELEVLNLVVQGLTNKQIARRLGITVGTVKGHVIRVYRKLDVRNRTQASVKVKELQLLQSMDW